MSQALTNLLSYIREKKDCCPKVRVVHYTDKVVIADYNCDSIDFEITPYECLRIIEDQGKNVRTFIIQDCTVKQDEVSVKVYHSNKLYLEFKFYR